MDAAQEGVVDFDAALAKLAPLEAKIKSSNFSYYDRITLERARLGLATVERLLSGHAPMAPYSTFDGGFLGAGMPPLNKPEKLQEHLQGIAYLIEHGMLAAAGFSAARFRFPLHPVPIGV